MEGMCTREYSSTIFNEGLKEFAKPDFLWNKCNYTKLNLRCLETNFDFV